MGLSKAYPIGRKGVKWTEADRLAWFNTRSIKRSYQQEVLAKIEALRTRFDLECYGKLSYQLSGHEMSYPLFCIKTKSWDKEKPVVLITGGVHGYETSGVHGALAFVDTLAEKYMAHFNFLVAPCVSPWGYESINRWNPNALDPNRNFYQDSPVQEAALLIQLIQGLAQEIFIHFDLHETTDTDESEFRPALAARDGIEHQTGEIPDGFYVVGDSLNPRLDFQNAVIEAVSAVTHIAKADAYGQLIGSEEVAEGVILYPMNSLGLCAGITGCQYSTTTEVYPDSPRVTDELCNQAQVAAIVGGLDYILSQQLA